MNTTGRPPIESTNGKGPSEPYEEMLRGFFRAEMPEPWPTLKLPERSVAATAPPQPATRGWLTRSKSRLALAASLLILLLGSWLLSGALRDGQRTMPAGGSMKNDTAFPHPGTVPPKSLEKVR